MRSFAIGVINGAMATAMEAMVAYSANKTAKNNPNGA
jgi:hypothetical protein